MHEAILLPKDRLEAFCAKWKIAELRVFRPRQPQGGSCLETSDHRRFSMVIGEAVHGGLTATDLLSAATRTG
jgi:hypothetical protein